MVGIIIVSHSQEVATGATELALQMAGGQPVSVVPAGGTDEGELGTSIEKVAGALEEVLSQEDGVLILADLGSAVMVAQMALEFLSPEQQERVLLSGAPLVEGAIAAVVAAAGGDDLVAVRRAAEEALRTPKIPSDEVPAEEPPAEEPVTGPEEQIEVTVPNPTGLHARPAARFVQTAMAFESDITVQNVTQGRKPANAKSMLDVASRGTAWQGEQIRVVARGEDAAQAVEALRQLVEGGFGEMEAAAVPAAPAPEPPSDDAAAMAPASLAPAGGEEAEGLLQGISASEGIAIAPAFRYDPPALEFEHRSVSDVEAEVDRLRGALEQAREELEALQAKVAEEDADAARIFEFQRMMLEDPALFSAIEEEIREEERNAEAAVDQVLEIWVLRFEQSEDAVMQLRAADMRDAGERVLRILLGIEEEPPLSALSDPVILIAHELTPSDTARLDRERVQGICTATGGSTSHVAILARMWSLPAVVGLGDRVLEIEEGILLAVDGEAGTVEIDPSPEIVETYQVRERRRVARLEEALRQIQEPAVTQDGQRVEVVANAGDVDSAREALEQGAEGIGLLRTEFLYLERAALPDEEEQVEVYRAIAQVMGKRPVIIRTLDVGGDKPLPAIPRPSEENPALGMRAIRLSQLYPDLLRIQLRAVLRAGVGHNLKVMFPLVATVEELRWARGLLDQAREELALEGVEHVEDLEVGVMIETPAAAMMADLMAPEVDFLSIGSNDLTQYTLAVDRGSQQLGGLFSALDPAVLRLIARAIEAGHAEGKWVGVCGELAGQRLAIPILLGLGLDEFSMTPQAIPLAKQRIRSLSVTQAREMAAHVLTLPTAAEVQTYVRSRLEDSHSDEEAMAAS